MTKKLKIIKMKKLFIILMLFTITLNAQTKVDNKGNFYSQSEKKSSYTLTTKLYTDSKGVIYSVYINDEGKYYIIRTSKKTGKPYKQQLKFNK